MNDQHTEGTISKIRGRIEEEFGRVSGNRNQQIRGKAHQIQGGAQLRFGDFQDAMHRRGHAREDAGWPTEILAGSDRADRRS
jgi:uncharacterized protein YjbJ (UPF0337 family)